ncbi:MAG: ribonuclease III [Leptolyngbyaceae bacterium]|nr:ribonuclease III [Leptolyngbyaceae bacterium]
MLSDPYRAKQLKSFIARLGLTHDSQVNWDLLDRALTHPSYSPEHNYEQLEFVGDAVIRLVAGEFLFEQFADASEGELTAIRSILVSDRTLSTIADGYGLDRFLNIAPSAVKDPTGEESRRAAAFEAVLGALYLSTHTFSLIRPWLDSHLMTHTDEVRSDPAYQNYKGALQGLTQERYQQLPEYRTTEIAQVHGDRERFEAEVWLLDQCWGRGKGHSKKAAEQVAAQIAYEAFQEKFN